MTQTDEIFALLDWNRPITEQVRGLSLARRVPDPGLFIQPTGDRAGKRVWDNCARILSDRADAELAPHLPALLKWLQDLNWPGALRILQRLRGYADREGLAAALDACARQARESRDEEWLEHLRMLASDEK